MTRCSRPVSQRRSATDAGDPDLQTRASDCEREGVRLIAARLRVEISNRSFAISRARARFHGLSVRARKRNVGTRPRNTRFDEDGRAKSK